MPEASARTDFIMEVRKYSRHVADVEFDGLAECAAGFEASDNERIGVASRSSRDSTAAAKMSTMH